MRCDVPFKCSKLRLFCFFFLTMSCRHWRLLILAVAWDIKSRIIVEICDKCKRMSHEHWHDTSRYKSLHRLNYEIISKFELITTCWHWHWTISSIPNHSLTLSTICSNLNNKNAYSTLFTSRANDVWFTLALSIISVTRIRTTLVTLTF